MSDTTIIVISCLAILAVIVISEIYNFYQYMGIKNKMKIKKWIKKYPELNEKFNELINLHGGYCLKVYKGMKTQFNINEENSQLRTELDLPKFQNVVKKKIYLHSNKGKRQ